MTELIFVRIVATWRSGRASTVPKWRFRDVVARKGTELMKKISTHRVTFLWISRMLAGTGAVRESITGAERCGVFPFRVPMLVPKMS